MPYGIFFLFVGYKNVLQKRNKKNNEVLKKVMYENN